MVNEIPPVFSPTLANQIASGTQLDVVQAKTLMAEMLSGELGDEAVSELLVAMNNRGYVASELVGFSEEMLAQSIQVEGGSGVVDIVGTGGSAHAKKASINVSTMASFVAAASGVKIAKHGNRKASSTSGSFDFLEALGVSFSESASEIEMRLNAKGLAFVFARKFHPRLAAVTGARNALGVPTVFNLLGPLCNPVRPTGIVLGANSAQTAKLIAEVLAQKQVAHGLVLYGHDGIDEFSLAAPTTVFEVDSHGIKEMTLEPADVGLEVVEQPLGGGPEENLRIFADLRAGEFTPATLLIAANSGLASYVSGLADSMKHGVEMSLEVVGSGRLDNYVNSFLN